MGYRIQSALKSDLMTPAEIEVFEALSAYTFDVEKTVMTDFTPTSVLYEAYRTKARTFDRTYGGSATILNAQQFGVALRRVFDIDPGRKAQRRYQGRAAWGYSHVRGPGSCVSRANPGNPNFQRPHASAASPICPEDEDGGLCSKCGLYTCRCPATAQAEGSDAAAPAASQTRLQAEHGDWPGGAVGSGGVVQAGLAGVRGDTRQL